ARSGEAHRREVSGCAARSGEGASFNEPERSREMLTIGDTFPAFKLKAVVSRDPADAFADIGSDSYPGKWLVVFFWPKDFTFVCPTEIRQFGELEPEFRAREAQVLGASV